MKNIALYISVSFMVVVGASCSNDFEFITEVSDTPIVYGVVNPKEEALALRLERAFVDPEISAPELAQDPDRIYYPNASVRIVNNTTTEVLELTRVDVSEENLPRDTGIFATTPNYLYRGESQDFVKGGDDLTLEINTLESPDVFVSEIQVLDSVTVRVPTSFNLVDFDPQEGGLTGFAFRHESDDPREYSVRFFLHYEEENEQGDFEPKSVIWDWGRVINDEPFTRFDVVGRSFYQRVADALDPLPDGRSRILRQFETQVTVLGPEFVEARDLQNANSGLTSSQDVPVYSNIEGGLGMFSSIAVANRLSDMTERTLNELRGGDLTGDLGFL